MDKNLLIAQDVLEKVGGKENVTSVIHCVTRLRFNLKDESKVDEEALMNVQGVVGTMRSGGLYQVIIGQNVEKVYAHLCGIGGFKAEAAIDENLGGVPGEKQKFSFKTIGNKILGYISPCMIGILPLMIGAAMCKTIGILLGPTVLNVISDTSDLYMMFVFLYDAFFYFLPIYLGYYAAKVLNTNVLLGMFLGAMIIVPDFIAMVGVRDTFAVFGIAVPVADYSKSFLPVILGVWIMSYVYKFFKKVIPDALATVFVPTLTILVMAIVMFAVCAPLGSYAGNIVGNFFIMLANSNSIVRTIGCIILGILFPYIVLGGMHLVLINFAIMTFLANGYESFVLSVSFGYSFAIYGVALGAMLKMKKKENKAMVLSYVASGLLAGISEPILYGIILKYKSAMKVLLIVCAIAGAYCGILQPDIYVAGSMCNVFSAVSSWVGGGIANIASGIILVILSFLAGTAASYFMIDFGGD